MKILIFSPLKFDSLTLKTHSISLSRVSKMHFRALVVVVKMRGQPIANDDPKGPLANGHP